jgi:hypothetical protein
MYAYKTIKKDSNKMSLVILTLLCMERVMGIEPTYSAWKADVLPLNYTRMFINI